MRGIKNQKSSRVAFHVLRQLCAESTCFDEVIPDETIFTGQCVAAAPGVALDELVRWCCGKVELFVGDVLYVARTVFLAAVTSVRVRCVLWLIRHLHGNFLLFFLHWNFLLFFFFAFTPLEIWRTNCCVIKFNPKLIWNCIKRFSSLYNALRQCLANYFNSRRTQLSKVFSRHTNSNVGLLITNQ